MQGTPAACPASLLLTISFDYLPAQAVATPLFHREHARGGGGHDNDEPLDARALRDGVGQGTGAERLRRLTLPGHPAGLNGLSLAVRRDGQRDQGIVEDGGLPALGLLNYYLQDLKFCFILCRKLLAHRSLGAMATACCSMLAFDLGKDKGVTGRRVERS